MKINYIPGKSTAWVVIHHSEMVVTSPTYHPFLVLTMENGSMTYDFRTSVQSFQKGVFNWVKVNTQLAPLLLTSCVLSILHFESKRYVHITTPYDRHQSDGCLGMACPQE